MQHKINLWRFTFLIALMLLASVVSFTQTLNDKEALRGLWQAQSIIVDGKKAPLPEAAKMQLTFNRDKLSIKGNFHNDDTMDVDYTIDPTQTPKHLNIIIPSQSEPVLAIYKLSGNTLKICFKKSKKAVKRPLKFESVSGSGLTLIVFNK